MFDALNVDEKNNPSDDDVASKIFEIMSCDNIYMLDIIAEPSDAMDGPTKKKALTEPDDGGHSIGTMTPLLTPLPLGKRIRDRNASFASELRARESDALRLAELNISIKGYFAEP